MTALRSALAFALLAFCSAEASRTQDSLRALPCPAPEDILPCVCSSSDLYGLEMDCSAVADEEELARVFSAQMPFTNFSSLFITGNDGLRTIRKGDLGPASFHDLVITGTSLEAIQEEALEQSYSTAKNLVLVQNKLSSFPFQELPLFTSCGYLDLSYNPLTELPRLESETITDFYLQSASVEKIPANTFQGLTSVRYLVVYDDDILEIQPGNFLNLADIVSIDFGSNNLTHIPKGAFELSANNLEELWLEDNNISTIDVGGITGFGNAELYLSGNSLATLAEEAFRPLFEAGNRLHLQGNPLECGCDLAWLLTNPTFMEQIDEASCSNGTLLSDLDPGVFLDLC